MSRVRRVVGKDFDELVLTPCYECQWDDGVCVVCGARLAWAQSSKVDEAGPR